MFEWGKCWTVNQNWIDKNISSFQKDVCLTEIRYCNSTDLAPCLCFAECKWVFSFLSSSAVKLTMKSQKCTENSLQWPPILLSNTRNWCLISKAAGKQPSVPDSLSVETQATNTSEKAHYQRGLTIKAGARQPLKKNFYLLLNWGAQGRVFMVDCRRELLWVLRELQFVMLNTRMSQPTINSALPHTDPWKPEIFWYWDFIATETEQPGDALLQIRIFKSSEPLKAVFHLGLPVWNTNKNLANLMTQQKNAFSVY